MHNSAVSESSTGPNGPRGCRTLRGHAPPSRNLCRGTAWQRALRADIVAPRSTLILAHAHKRALHAHGAWCGDALAGCRTEHCHASHGRILHRDTAWQGALRAKPGTQPSTDPRTRTHNAHVHARTAPGALCVVRRPVLTAALAVRSAIDFAMVTYHPPLAFLRRWP